MTPEEKALNLMGLAMRAGSIISGESFVLEAVRSRRGKIVLLANDASENTKKKFLDKCHFYGVPISSRFTKEEISRAIGKERVVLTLTDKGFSARLQELLIN